MWIFFDLIIVAILLFFTITSAKRGFIRAAIEFIGFGLSVCVAFMVGGFAADAVYDTVIQPAIVDATVDAASETASNGIKDAVDITWDSLPSYVVDIADNFGVTSDTVYNNIAESARDEINTRSIVESAVKTIVEPVLVPVIKSVIGVLIFIVLMFAVRFLSRRLNKAFNVSIIGGLNKTLGGILGFGKGLVVSAVVAVLVKAIVSFTNNGFWFFTIENIENSYLFGFLAAFSPII